MLLEDLLIMARTIWGEARDQPYEGQKAIAHLILNRVSNKVGDPDHTIAAVCLRFLQFSCWNEDDVNRPQLLAVTLDDKWFRIAMRAALEACDEADFTFGSKHYHSKKVSPSWSNGKTPCLVIGDHIFFNNVQ